MAYDLETGKVTPPGWWRKLLDKLKSKPKK